VLEQVPRMFADTQVLDSCFGGAIEAAIEVRGLLRESGLGLSQISLDLWVWDGLLARLTPVA